MTGRDPLGLRTARAVALAILCVAPGLEAKAGFTVPAHCGDRTVFEAEISKRLGGGSAAALLDVLELTISEKSNTYSLAMRVGNEARQLEDPNCADLFQAAVVVAVALWEEPKAAIPLGPRTTAAAVPKPGPAASPDSGPRGSGALVPSATPLRWFLAGEVGANWGLRPNFGPILGMRGAIDTSRFGAVAAVRWLPRNQSLDGNSRGVGVSGLGAGVGAYVALLNSVRLELGVSAYRLFGSGLGSRTEKNAALTSFGPHLGLRVTPWSSDWGYFALGAEGHLELLPLRFEILGYGEVFRIPWCTANGVLEVGYRFR
ncbi:MAG TPA: hypothetical protein VKP30_19160 [Polyangiaceae bacterium]|nr:hypothetical protein [Polyangiaceae bacterium]